MGALQCLGDGYYPLYFQRYLEVWYLRSGILQGSRIYFTYMHFHNQASFSKKNQGV